MDKEQQKKAAAEYAVGIVASDLKIGLGTGSTANYFIAATAEKVKREKLNTVFVATSTASETLAKSLGLDVRSIEDVPILDYTVDGADEIDPQFRMIKGAGGALMREKIVASSSKYMVCIADKSKLVDTLGAFPLPIEIAVFGVSATSWKIQTVLARLGFKNAKMRLRAKADGTPYITDNGNPIIDLLLNEIIEPERLNAELIALPGVVDTGLFIGICGALIVGTDDGVKEIARP